MRQYGTVHTRFWIGDTAKNMSNEQKLIFLYFLTSPHSNPTGCYRLPLAYIESDLKWPSETVMETINETVSIGLIEYDFLHEIVLVKSFLDYNPIANPNVAKNCMQFIEIVSKKSIIYQSLIKSLSIFEERFPNGYINGLCNGMPNRTLPYPDPDPDPNNTPSIPQTEKIEKPPKAERDFKYEKAVGEFIIERFPSLMAKNRMAIHQWKIAGYEFDTIKAVVDATHEEGVDVTSFNFFTIRLQNLNRKPAGRKHTTGAEDYERLKAKGLIK